MSFPAAMVKGLQVIIGVIIVLTALVVYLVGFRIIFQFILAFEMEFLPFLYGNYFTKLFG
ncbi:hypothetical protein V6C27_08735 [Peptococcaceae bacterium 1198_IL3148]